MTSSALHFRFETAHMDRPHPVLPLQHFQRISNAIAGVILAENASLIGKCVLFGLMGERLLRTKYGLADARAVVGAFYVCVTPGNVIAFAGHQGTTDNRQNFHCWVEAAGSLFDFSSFLYPVLARAHLTTSCPSLMFQKRASQAVASPSDLQKPSDFITQEDQGLRQQTLDATLSFPAMGDILEILEGWYQPPPRKMQTIGLSDGKGVVKPVSMHDSVLLGAW